MSSADPVSRFPYCWISYQSGIESPSESCVVCTYSATAVLSCVIVKVACVRAMPEVDSCLTPLSFHWPNRYPHCSSDGAVVVKLVPGGTHSCRAIAPGGLELSV